MYIDKQVIFTAIVVIIIGLITPGVVAGFFDARAELKQAKVEAGYAN